MPITRRPPLVKGLAVAALLLLASLPAVFTQIRDVDVLLYASAAVRSNAEGSLPYVVAWIEKGPLAMALFQGLFALGGAYNFAAIVGAWLVLVLTCAFAAAALARAMGAGRSAWWAAVLVAVAVGAVGGSLNTEVPASLLVALAALAWGHSLGEPSRQRWRLLAGALVSGAFLCRQNAGAALPLLLALEFGGGSTRGADLVAASRRAATLLVGFLLPLVVVLGVYAAAGHLEVFRFCFYGYNREIYLAATRLDLDRLLRAPWDAIRNFLLPVPTLSALGLLGLAPALAQGGTNRRLVRGVALLAVVLTLSLFVGFRFFSHYFMLPLPLWAALGALGLEWLRSRSTARRRIVLGVVIAALVLEVGRRPVWRSLERLGSWTRSGRILESADPIAWPGRDGLATRVARHIREDGAPEDRVFVWGMRPHVYVYAQRVPATRFVTCTFLTGLVPWERVAPGDDTRPWIVPGAWEALMDDLERERPRYIVDASHDHLFGDGAYAPEAFPPLARLLEESYDKVLEVGESDRMVVFKRKGQGR